MAYKFTKDQVLNAIKGTRGITEAIAKKLGCGWHAAQDAVNRWEETRAEVIVERERSLDFAEGVVLDAISKKDVKTAKWYLMMKGKERGYLQDNVLRIDNQDPLNISIDGMTREQLAASEFVEINDTEATQDQ